MDMLKQRIVSKKVRINEKKNRIVLIFLFFTFASSITSARNIREIDLDSGPIFSTGPATYFSILLVGVVIFAFYFFYIKIKCLYSKLTKKSVYKAKCGSIGATSLLKLKETLKSIKSEKEGTQPNDVFYGNDGVYSIDYGGSQFIIISKGINYCKIRGSIEIPGDCYGYEWVELYVKTDSLIKTADRIDDEIEIYNIYGYPGYESRIPKVFRDRFLKSHYPYNIEE